MKKSEKEKKDTIQINIDKTKLLKGLGIGFIAIIILGVAFLANSNYSPKNVKFNNITIDEYLELMSKNQKDDTKQIVYVASPSCSYCNMETPILKKIVGKYELQVNYLNTEKFYDASKEDYTEDGYKFINSSDIYKNGYGTPNIIIIQNGEIIDGIYQYAEASQIEELFKNNNLIKEKN